MGLRKMLPALAVMLVPLPVFAEPNILLIIADDMGIDASFCYALGDQQAPMPNIEALCETGLVFENAYAAPTCSPTRATIMSGLYGFRTGVGAPVDPNGSDQLSVDTPTIFDALAPSGYASNVIGKWHISGRNLGYDAPEQMGVSDYFGLYAGGIQDYFDWTAIEDGEEVQIEGYSTTVLTDRAIDWIAAQDQPWFLWLAYNAPHAPFHLPPADLHSFDDLPDGDAAIAANPLPYYQAMLEALDTEIGRLLGSLSEEARADTIVIFIGDNGTPNQVTRDLFADHGAKGTIYDSGTRVPLIVSGPNIEAGRTDVFVNITDLHATIAELAGAEVSTPDSISFAPVLAGEPGTRDVVYVEHFTNRETRGGGIYGWTLRQGDFKLVVAEGQDPELYNLAEDPFELHDLLADRATNEHMAIAEELQARQVDLIARQN
ncbi:sulfatase-like hydrolase/transferase [Gymnodinialimonas sp. 2305UL16-5]|uniref:sulfatase-like hydrolase/transferase n=1 Tax=Gymnodinialimonas mytili TaxID=3126503 RepID=UPI0030AD1C93